MFDSEADAEVVVLEGGTEEVVVVVVNVGVVEDVEGKHSADDENSTRSTCFIYQEEYRLRRCLCNLWASGCYCAFR